MAHAHYLLPVLYSGHINTLVDGAGEKLAGRKGSTPVSASGERSIDIAERGVAEFKEGIAALKGSSPRRSTSLRSSSPKSPRSSASTATTDATLVGGSSPLRRMPPPIHPETKDMAPTTTGDGYDPDPKELRDSDIERRASPAPSDTTTTTTRAVYGSLIGHGNADEGGVDSSHLTPVVPATANGVTTDHDAVEVQSPTRMDSYTSGNTVYASAEDVSTIGNPPPLPPRTHA